MQPRQLMHFLAALDRGSMTHAAIDQNVSQPALSRSIRMLELELKIELFQRGYNGVVPTREGRIFAEHARRIVASIQFAHEDISAIRAGGGRIGHVRIGLTETATSSRLFRSMTSLALDRSDWRISLEYDLQNVLLGKLRRNEIDAMIDFDRRDLDFGDLNFQPLMKLAMVVLARAGHPASRGTMTVQELSTYPWAVLDDSGTEYWLRRTFRTVGDPPIVLMRCMAPGLLRQIARESDYLILACKPEGGASQRHDGLCEIPIDAPAETFFLSLITLRRSHATPGMKRALRDIATTLSEESYGQAPLI